MNKLVKRTNKKWFTILLMMVVCVMCVSAQDSSDAFGLGDKVNILLQFLSSPWVKGVACIALIAETIGLITAGRQEPGMFKKFIPWIAGTIIFMAAGTITTKFMSGVTTSTFTEVTEK